MRAAGAVTPAPDLRPPGWLGSQEDEENRLRRLTFLLIPSLALAQTGGQTQGKTDHQSSEGGKPGPSPGKNGNGSDANGASTPGDNGSDANATTAPSSKPPTKASP
jgi:hypothetical protein